MIEKYVSDPEQQILCLMAHIDNWASISVLHMLNLLERQEHEENQIKCKNCPHCKHNGSNRDGPDYKCDVLYNLRKEMEKKYGFMVSSKWGVSPWIEKDDNCRLLYILNTGVECKLYQKEDK